MDGTVKKRRVRFNSTDSNIPDHEAAKVTPPSCNYTTFLQVLSKLTPAQRNVLEDIGFSSLLHLSCAEVPVELFKWLSDNLDTSTRTLKLPNGFSFTINAKCVQTVLGIPNGTSKIDSKATEESFLFMRELVPCRGQKPTVQELCDMVTPDLDGRSFARIFMLIALSTFLCPNSRKVCSSRYYSAILNISKIRELDWCTFVLEWLLSYVKKYQNVQHDHLLAPNGGCALLLVVIYLEFLSCSEFNFHCKSPFLAFWTTSVIQTFTLLDCTSSSTNNFNFGRLPMKHLCSTIFQKCFASESNDYFLPEDIVSLLQSMIPEDKLQNVVKQISDVSTNLHAPYIHAVLRILCKNLSDAVCMRRYENSYIEETDSENDDNVTAPKVRKIEHEKEQKHSAKDFEYLMKYGLLLPTRELQDSFSHCSHIFSNLLHKISSELSIDSETDDDFFSFPSIEDSFVTKIDDTNLIQIHSSPIGIKSLVSDSCIISAKHKLPSAEKHIELNFNSSTLESSQDYCQKDSKEYIYDDAGRLLKNKPTTTEEVPYNSSYSKIPYVTMPDDSIPSFDIFQDVDEQETATDTLKINLPKITGLRKGFVKSSELIQQGAEESVGQSGIPSKKKTGNQIFFPTHLEYSFYSIMTTNICKTSYRIFQIGNTWIDEWICCLSLMPSGWIHRHVMDGFCRMLENEQLRSDKINMHAEGLIHHQYFDNKTVEILMKPQLNFNNFKDDFLQAVGFNIDQCALLHIPCYIEKQWILIVVNFVDKKFNVLNPEYGADKVLSKINSVIYNFRIFFIKGFPNYSKFTIRDFPVCHLDVPKQKFSYDSGVFVIMYLQTYNGINVVPFSIADIPALREKFMFQLAFYQDNKAYNPKMAHFREINGLKT
ncbi:hypothetical protein ACP70R_015517 [Stipagrostis hirtigluma subsp. patula]